MAGVYKFQSVALPSNKKGVLKPDSDGYYTLVVGGLNMYNSQNQYYALEGARELFEESSALMRRMQRGAVKGEVGHPRQELGMSTESYINRLYEIRETNTCCVFKDITLDANYGNNNGKPGVVGIIAKVAPSGPFGPALEQALQRPGENVCFSVRGFTDDFFDKGRYTRVLKQIIGWDWVTEPGLEIAEKFKSPGLEDLVTLESLSEVTFNRSNIEHLLNNTNSFALESTKESIRETLRLFDIKENKVGSKLSNW